MYGCVDLFEDAYLYVYLYLGVYVYDVAADNDEMNCDEISACQAPQCFLATRCRCVLKMSRWDIVRDLEDFGVRI